MIRCLENFPLVLRVNLLILFLDDILSQDFHGKVLVQNPVSDQHDLSEGASTDYFNQIEVLQRELLHRLIFYRYLLGIARYDWSVSGAIIR